MKLPKKRDHQHHLQHSYYTTRAAADAAVRTGVELDARCLAVANGILYFLGSVLVWLTPLRFLAKVAHVPTIRWNGRREHLFADQPFRDPFRTWVVTRWFDKRLEA